jgi:hypothetical protein
MGVLTPILMSMIIFSRLDRKTKRRKQKGMYPVYFVQNEGREI